jgi:hypothetical protein
MAASRCGASHVQPDRGLTLASELFTDNMSRPSRHVAIRFVPAAGDQVLCALNLDFAAACLEVSLLERDDFSLSHHPALTFCFARDLFRKPVPTFRDHALMIASPDIDLRDWRLVAVGEAVPLGEPRRRRLRRGTAGRADAKQRDRGGSRHPGDRSCDPARHD